MKAAELRAVTMHVDVLRDKGATLQAHAGKRARKGKAVDGLQKVVGLKALCAVPRR